MSDTTLCKQALDVHESHLASLEGVVGLGIVHEDDAGDAKSKEQVVAVYVEKKIPDMDLKKADWIPKTLEIEVKGKKVQVKTKVIEQGRPEFESAPQRESL